MCPLRSEFHSIHMLITVQGLRVKKINIYVHLRIPAEANRKQKHEQ